MNPKLSISATKTYQLWIQDSRFRARPRFLYDSLIVARKVAAGDIIATTKQNSIVINPFGTQEQKTARHELVHVAQFSKSVSVLKPNCLQRYFSCDAAIEGAATFLSERELPNNSLPKTFEQFFDASLAQRLSSQALWIARANNSRGRENAFKYTIPAAIIAWRASRSGPENAIKEYMSKPACLYSLERGTSTKLIQ